MAPLLRHLHRFRWTLILAVVCTCLQVFFELQLPGYMSDLVNTGIQSYGIEEAAPERLTAEDARLLESGMLPAERRLLRESYEEGADGILERRPLTPEALAALDGAIVVSEWTILDMIAALPGGRDVGWAASSETIPDLSDVNLRVIRSSATLLADQPDAAAAAARRSAEAIPPRLAAQTGAAFAAAFHEAAGQDPQVFQRSYMLKTGGGMALCAGIAACFSFLTSLMAAQTGAGLARNLRRAVFVRVQDFTRADFDHFTKASLLARTTTDITLVQSSTVAFIRIILFAFCMGLGGIILAALSSAALAWILTGAVAAISAVVWCILRITRPRYRIVQNMIDRLNLITREDVEGAATIRVFGGEEQEEKRFDKANDLLSTTQLGINRVLIFLSPAFGLVLNLTSLAIVWLGADAVARSAIEVGTIIADIQYAGVVLSAFVLIAGMFVIVPRTAVAAERIRAVLSRKQPETASAAAPEDAEPGSLTAENLVFRYPGAPSPALNGVSFIADPGQITAIVGQTGSGKTTLLDLLVRAHEPEGGTVRLGGRDLRTLDQDALDAALSYLPQEREPLGTVPAPDFAEPGWVPAAGEVRRRDLKAPVLRRLVLGQAASAYLLDEPFAGLRETDHPALWQQLRRAAGQGPVIMAVSHVRWASRADQILVLEHGKITARGTHRELLAASDLYRRLTQAEGEGDAT